jgi:hypothetical protein
VYEQISVKGQQLHSVFVEWQYFDAISKRLRLKELAFLFGTSLLAVFSSSASECTG